MVFIPGLLVNKVYEQGSLRNTEDGFEFRFANRMTPLRISGMRDIALEVDGRRYSAEDIELELGGKTIRVNDESAVGVYSFDKNSNLAVRVKGKKLEKGSHAIKISFITNEYGGATLKVGDTLGEKTRFPLIKFVFELIGRISGIESASKPLRIDGNFPVLNSIIDGIEKISGAGAWTKPKPLKIKGELGGEPLDPDFSRLKTALDREEADRVPFFEAEIAMPIQEWFLGRDINSAADEIEFFVRAGYDYVPVVPPFFAPRIMRSATGSGSNLSDDNSQWITESEGFIKTISDVEKFPWPKAEDVDFSSFREVAELLPEKMKIIGMLVPAAVFGNASQAMGLQNFSYALYDNPRVPEALFEIIGPTYVEIAKRLVKTPKLGAVFMSDDIAHGTGLLVSPATLRKYVFPWYKRIGEIVRGAGLHFIYHSDGKLTGVFDDLADCGITAVHPIEPLAMDIIEVKKKHGDKFCIFGNIDLEHTLTRGSPEETVALVKEKIRDLAPGGGWGLSASNSIPHYAIPANYRAMLEAGMKYGKYPISF